MEWLQFSLYMCPEDVTGKGVLYLSILNTGQVDRRLAWFAVHTLAFNKIGTREHGTNLLLTMREITCVPDPFPHTYLLCSWLILPAYIHAYSPHHCWCFRRMAKGKRRIITSFVLALSLAGGLDCLWRIMSFSIVSTLNRYYNKIRGLKQEYAQISSNSLIGVLSLRVSTDAVT